MTYSTILERQKFLLNNHSPNKLDNFLAILDLGRFILNYIFVIRVFCSICIHTRFYIINYGCTFTGKMTSIFNNIRSSRSVREIISFVSTYRIFIKKFYYSIIIRKFSTTIISSFLKLRTNKMTT